MNDDLSHLSLLEIFRVESENQTALLTSGLLELERLTGTAENAKQKAEMGNAETGKPGTSVVPPWNTCADPPGAPGASKPRGEHPQLAAGLESLMRAAHSLKGAARIVGLDPAVRIAHALEDCFVAAQHGRVRLASAQIDLLFRGVDLLQHIGRRSFQSGAAASPDDPTDLDHWTTAHEPEIRAFLEDTARLLRKTASREAREDREAGEGGVSYPSPPSSPSRDPCSLPSVASDRVLRLTAENLNRLLGLAGESLVESRWLRPFTENMQRLKRQHAEVANAFHQLRAQITEANAAKQDSPFSPFPPVTSASALLADIARRLSECRSFMDDRLDELDRFDRRSAQRSHRLYLEALRTRMRPFSDAARRFPRMVRDLAKSLGKDVRLVIAGESTQVDRDILEKLETPLAHLLRNAVDHGCESPALRQQLGKPPTATLRLEARHSAGLLLVTVSDDGAGVNPNHIREKLKAESRKQSAENPFRLSDFHISALSEADLLEFLFLPGFTLKDSVTEISGRGVGLDVVQNMVKSVRGSIRISSQPGPPADFPAPQKPTEATELAGSREGREAGEGGVSYPSPPSSPSRDTRSGFRVELQLPLTLSVVRALLVEIGGEPYALPLRQISRTLLLPRARIQSLEGRHHFRLDPLPGGGSREAGEGAERTEGNEGCEGLPPSPREVVVAPGRAPAGEVTSRGESIGLLAAHQIFGCGAPDASAPCLPVVVLGWPGAVAREGREGGEGGAAHPSQPSSPSRDSLSRQSIGLLVDRFLGERELVVLPLDPRLGKVKDISAAALLEDGSPVLIVDVDDLLRSVEKLIAEGAVLRVRGGTTGEASPRRKRVLAVDDSLTVRELERKLLASHGYEADVAVDGMDGWNAVRAGHYDLVITDVDMPRLDGIELTRLIKKDPKLEALPVLIVSYKDRDEDRLRGLEAGADYYLTKSSFHDVRLLQAVADLIGEAGT